jgi:hypothetical protein
VNDKFHSLPQRVAILLKILTGHETIRPNRL